MRKGVPCRPPFDLFPPPPAFSPPPALSPRPISHPSRIILPMFLSSIKLPVLSSPKFYQRWNDRRVPQRFVHEPFTITHFPQQFGYNTLAIFPFFFISMNIFLKALSQANPLSMAINIIFVQRFHHSNACLYSFSFASPTSYTDCTPIAHLLHTYCRPIATVQTLFPLSVLRFSPLHHMQCSTSSRNCTERSTTFSYRRVVL